MTAVHGGKFPALPRQQKPYRSVCFRRVSSTVKRCSIKKPRVCRGLAAGSLTLGRGWGRRGGIVCALFLCVKGDYIPDLL